MSYYAVAKGRNPGIYHTWDKCKEQVHHCSGSVYKKFSSKAEAESFITKNSDVPSKSEISATTSYGSEMSTSTSHRSGISAPTFGGSGISSTTTNSFSSNKFNSFDMNKRSYSFTSKRFRSPSSDNNYNGRYQNKCFKKRRYNESYSNFNAKDQNNVTVDANGFFIDKNGYTEVYTDGACNMNGSNNAKAGIGVWFSDDNAYNVSQPVFGRATNNMAEIQAVTIAALQAQKAGIKKLKIHTDSKFLISCITKWMPNWKKKGWKTMNGNNVINKDELIEMEKALAPLQILWNHVKGHVGIHGNEMADKLARKGSEHYRKK